LGTGGHMELRTGYKRTEVGVIPEDWDVKPLGSTLVRGNRTKHK
jgi:hypothetical protein